MRCSPARVADFWRGKGFLLKTGRSTFCTSHPEGHGHCAGNLKPLQRTRPRHLVAKSFPGILQAEQLQLRNKGIIGRLGSAGMQQPRGHFLSRLSKNIHSRQWAFLTVVNCFSFLSKSCILISWALSLFCHPINTRIPLSLLTLSVLPRIFIFPFPFISHFLICK